LLPPLSEQHGIAAKLDSLTSRTARAREELGRIPRLVERYKGALLAAAFQDGFGIENAASCFVPRPLSAAVISTFYGPRIAREAYVSSGIPTLRTTDIGEWGRLCPQDPPQVNVGQQERSKWAFQDGDLMVTRTGATIGKCAVYEDRFGPALPSAYLIRVRLDMQVVVSRFVLLFLLSPKGQRQLLDGRTAVAQPNINANAILSVELPLPPLGATALGGRSLTAISRGGFGLDRHFAPAQRRAPLIWNYSKLRDGAGSVLRGDAARAAVEPNSWRHAADLIERAWLHPAHCSIRA